MRLLLKSAGFAVTAQAPPGCAPADPGTAGGFLSGRGCCRPRRDRAGGRGGGGDEARRGASFRSRHPLTLRAHGPSRLQRRPRSVTHRSQHRPRVTHCNAVLARLDRELKSDMIVGGVLGAAAPFHKVTASVQSQACSSQQDCVKHRTSTALRPSCAHGGTGRGVTALPLRGRRRAAPSPSGSQRPPPDRSAPPPPDRSAPPPPDRSAPPPLSPRAPCCLSPIILCLPHLAAFVTWRI